jgi:uncharacterized protein (DUF2141 family)
MKKNPVIRTTFLKTCLYIFFTFQSILMVKAQKPEFKLQLSNLKKNPSNVYVAFFKKGSDFPKDEAVTIGKVFKSSGKGTDTVIWTDIPANEYAIAIFQDLNGNGKIDTNLIGYPTEPFAFSNNFKPRFSAPKFNDCKFVYDGGILTINIKMIN